MKTDRANFTETHGFTLLELLIAIGIVAILLMLAASALSGARFSADNVRCMNQLKRLGNAALAYSGDHNNRLLPGLYREGTTVSLPWSRILNGLPGTNYLYPLSYPPTQASLATKASAFDCPVRKTAATYDNLHYGYSSFPGFTIYDDAGAGMVRRLTDIQRPSQTLLFGEIPSGYRLLPHRVDLLELPHRGRMNAFYADGSIRAIQPLQNANTASADPQPPFY